MSLMKKLLIILLLAFVVIQFFRPARNEGSASTPNDITLAVNVPPDVKTVLERSCYDCHSNHTKYPWYMNVQPVAWYLAHHVEEGKRELNFSEFATYKPKRQLRKFQEITKQIEKGEMPLSSYTLIHQDAKLSDADKALLIAWADSAAARF